MSKIYDRAKAYTEKYKALLVPCKYCGADGVQITVDRTMFPPHYVWSATCPTRGCDSITATTAKAAAKEWMGRHAQNV